MAIDRYRSRYKFFSGIFKLKKIEVNNFNVYITISIKIIFIIYLLTKSCFSFEIFETLFNRIRIYSTDTFDPISARQDSLHRFLRDTAIVEGQAPG